MTHPARSSQPSDRGAARFITTLPIFSITFLPVCFLYVWIRIEPALEYQRSTPEFLLGASFLRGYLTYPGGLVNYAAAFLAQLNIQSWLGAVVFTCLCGASVVLSRWLFGTLLNWRADVTALVIPFLLLLLKDRYHAQTLVLTVGLTVALGCSVAVTSMPGKKRFPVPIDCWVAAPLLFYVAGNWVLAAFTLICCLDAAIRWKSPVRAVLCLACLLAAPLWLWWSGDAELSRVLDPWKKGLGLGAAVAAYGFAPLVVVAISVQRALARAAEQRHSSEHKPRHGEKPKGQKTGGKRGHAAWLKLPAFGAACAVVWFAFDPSAKARAQVDYFTARGQYAKVPPIAVGIRRDDLDPATEIQLQSALYHTGRLCEDLFSFPNQSSCAVLPGLSVGIEACRAQSAVLLELGFVSDAEHYAHEALEVEGAKPEILRLLASVNLLKQRPKAARVFLTVLSQVPFQRSRAEAWLRALPEDPPPPDGSELARIRSCMFTNDLPHDALPAEPLLRQLLYRNETNRMAFEYLMAYYLTRLQTDKIIEALPAFEFLEYRQLPRHIEEAILLHEKVLNKKVELRSCKIRPETSKRFRRFSADLDRNLEQTEEGRRELTRDFGDTFWYFYLARKSR